MRHCARVHNQRGRRCHSHSADKDTESQGGYITCPRTHGWQIEFKFRSESKASALYDTPRHSCVLGTMWVTQRVCGLHTWISERQGTSSGGISTSTLPTPASPVVEPLPGGVPLANAVLFGDPPWDALPQRQALVNKGATGNLFAGETFESKKPERRGQKSGKAVCVAAADSIQLATGLDHTKVLPGWSVRTQQWERCLHVGLGRKIRKINLLLPQLHNAASQRETTFAIFAACIFASFNPEHSEEL